MPPSTFMERYKNLRISRLFNKAGEEPELPAAPAPRDYSMVPDEHPYPHPRPHSAIADAVDAQTFNQRWDRARARAARGQTSNPQTGDYAMSDDFNETGQQHSENQHPNRPAETLREGQLKAAIWRNENENGAYHSVTVSRTYKDQEGNVRDTSSFRPRDMLGLAELARRAHHEVRDHDRELFKEQRREQAQTRGPRHSR